MDRHILPPLKDERLRMMTLFSMSEGKQAVETIFGEVESVMFAETRTKK